MELKMKYHYSYFIYPYVIKKAKYNKYIQRLNNMSKIKPQFFKREQDAGIYKFFLPSIRKYMFNSFDLADNYSEEGKGLYDKLKENIFKSGDVSVFNYDIGKDIQGKVEEKNGIFFRVEEIKIVCFKTGICFLVFKTDLEDTSKFSDLLNFNFKFRDINSNDIGTDNIKLQTSMFDDVKKLSDIIFELTGSTKDSEKIDIDINRFFTYSYVCIDQEFWNDKKPFADIKKEFDKFSNLLNSEYNSSYDNDKLNVVSLGNYIKIGISKMGVTFLTSSINTVNYTSLPVEFENEYFYTYIFALYEKFYLAKIMKDFASHIKTYNAAKEFVKFTNDLWVKEITNQDNGSLIFENMKNAMELNTIYEKAKEQYDLDYKNFKMKNSEMLNKVILVLLAISIITNIVNFINLGRLR